MDNNIIWTLTLNSIRLNSCDNEIAVAIAPCEQAFYCTKCPWTPNNFLLSSSNSAVPLWHYLSAIPPSSSGRNYQFLDLWRLKLSRCYKVSQIFQYHRISICHLHQIVIVGDNLSLGDYDFELHPPAVKDYRLLGVVSEVEDLLNKQIMSPVQHRRTALRNGYVVSTMSNWIVRFVLPVSNPK